MALAGMTASNVAHARGVPFYLSRKVAHFGGLIPLLLMPFWFDSPEWPVLLASGLTLIVWAGNRLHWTRGFARDGRISDIIFPAAVAFTMAVLWHKGPWVAIVPAVWLSLGDGITGLVRMKIYGREVKGNWGSVACYLVCGVTGLAMGLPLLAALIGGGVATLAERVSGDSEGSILRIDDNLTMPLAGALALFILV